jgi:ABC-type methionine transport system ATPase subunit
VLLLEDVVATAAGRRVLDGAQLAVRRGEHMGVLAVGPAERQVLIDLLSGARAPDAGRVRVDGLDPVREASALRGRISTDARADAAVLLLDVGSGTDAAELDRLAGLIGGRQHGPTVLLLTPSPVVARRFCSRCAVLSGGRLLDLGRG